MALVSCASASTSIRWNEYKRGGRRADAGTMHSAGGDGTNGVTHNKAFISERSTLMNSGKIARQ